MNKSFFSIFGLFCLIYTSAQDSTSIDNITAVLSGKAIREVVSMSTLMGTGSGISNLPLCKENAHTEGRWVYRDEIVDKDFVCCSYDANDYTFNSSACGAHNYVWVPYYNGSDTRYTWTGGHGCSCDKRSNNRYTPNVREKYIWQPSTCRLLPWNGKQFCGLLGSRRIMFIGDSTMKQSMATIASMIFEHHGGCARNLIYVDNPKLVLILQSASQDQFLNKHPYTAFLAATEMHMPEIIFATIGPHVHSLKEYNTFENDFEKRFFPLFYDQNHFPKDRKLIFRGQHPGHSQCMRYVKPVDSKSAAETEKLLPDPYHWSIIKKFDDRMKSLVHRTRIKYEKALATPTRIFFMDTSPLSSRPDAHIDQKDCLHFCLPGPLSIEANILLTKLVTGEL
jgi:hypothetical protein